MRDYRRDSRSELTRKGHHVQHRSAAARQYLADRSQPSASRPRPQRPSATLPPPATDQKA